MLKQMMLVAAERPTMSQTVRKRRAEKMMRERGKNNKNPIKE